MHDLRLALRMMVTHRWFSFAGVAPREPVTLALTVVGLLACWLPARRAALVAPVRALAQNERR
jgi:hypothetical protein